MLEVLFMLAGMLIGGIIGYLYARGKHLDGVDRLNTKTIGADRELIEREIAIKEGKKDE